MLSLLAAATLATTPLTIFVETIRSEEANAQKAHVWTQQLAEQLRQRGFRVTTQDELAQLLSGEAQRQKLGCADKDCGLDQDIMAKADVKLSGLVAGLDTYLVSLTSYRLKPKMEPWAFVNTSDSDPADALAELLPALLEKMRAGAQPGEIPEQKPSGSAEPKSADAHKRCAAAPGALALAALLALPWRRRSWNWRPEAG